MTLSRAPRWFLWILFFALLVPTGIRLERQIRDSLALPRGTQHFYDFRIFQRTVRDVRQGKPLYQTDQENYFKPGSPVYKYPPPFAAILHPIDTYRWKPVARGFYWANLTLLALTLGFLLISFSSTLDRKLGATLVFLAWQPFHESLAGLQLEPLMIFFVALGLALGRNQRTQSAAVAFAVGAAAAFKVYPVVLGSFFLIRRDWRGIGAACAGGALVLGLSAIPLSLRDSWIYFTEVLPGLGGTSLSPDNLSLLANLGRAFLRLLVEAETFSAFTSTGRQLRTLETSGVAWLSPISKLLLLASTAALIWITTWRLHRVVPPRETKWVGFFCSICLMTLLIPTSWLDYQTWLILPTVYLTCRAHSPMAWGLLAISVVPAVTINSLDPSYLDHQLLYSVLRSLIPIALWAGLLDLRQNDPDPTVSGP